MDNKDETCDKTKSVFDHLNCIDVSEYVKSKNKLKYLTWSWAWAKLMKKFPNATYKIKTFENNLPYVFGKDTGYMVFTSVTINGITRDMWLPVMNGANKSMTDHEYTYIGTGYEHGKKIDIKKKVEKATMFDINKTIMRCLTKNIAMFGLGLYIYSGEDMPEDDNEPNISAIEQPIEPTIEPTIEPPITNIDILTLISDENLLEHKVEQIDVKEYLIFSKMIDREDKLSVINSGEKTALKTRIINNFDGFIKKVKEHKGE